MKKKAHLFADVYIGDLLSEHLDAGLLTFTEASYEIDRAKDLYNTFFDILKDDGITHITLRWRYDANNFIFDSWRPEGLDNE